MLTLELKNKKVLVIGFAVTGIPLVKVLNTLGASIIVNDLRTEEDLKDSIAELHGIDVNYYLGKHPDNIEELGKIDLAIISPGIPLTIPFVREIQKSGIELIGEIELAYRLSRGTIIAITGTNGKTTTTALMGEIFKNANRTTHVVGNIGVAAISKALETKEDDYIIMEISSFQLESCVYFHPHIATVLNITPDHLNRHGNMENYADIKFSIFKNQNQRDYAIINYDNDITYDKSKDLNNVIYFSRISELERGVFVKDNNIIIKENENEIEVIHIKDIRIPGMHNVENALAATAMSYYSGISVETIRETLKTFKGVEHRIQYVDSINGVSFYNDSKATNINSTIKAIEAVEAPIILLAGGMDKGDAFDLLFEGLNNKVKSMFVYGETASKILDSARKYGFNAIFKVTNLKEAVMGAYKISNDGDSILLSPACASWDMYKNFEERGKEFINLVANLRG